MKTVSTIRHIRAAGHETVSDADPRLQPRYSIGQSVKHKAFTDCFGKHHAERRGLEVTAIEIVHSYAPHVRIVATGKGGYVEAAERFFDADN